MTAQEERAWDLYCRYTAGSMHVVDFWDELNPEGQDFYLNAQAILAALPSMVLPLVWDGVKNNYFISCDMGTHSYELSVVDTLERSCDYSWGAVYNPSGSRAINIPTPAQATLDDARAAANAHHVAAIMEAFGEVT